MQPLVYSRFRLVTPDDAVLEATPCEPFPFVPSSEFRITTLLDEPALQAVHEDWFKGHDVEWVYWVDAVHFVLLGEAEITYRDPPAWEAERTVVARAGSFFLAPRGLHMKARVTSEEPFRRVVLDIPNPGYSFPGPDGPAEG